VARRAARGGGGGALEAGEDGADEEDGEEADVRSMEIKSPGGQGKSGRKPPTFRGARALAGRWTADFGRPPAVENPVGQRMSGAAEGGSRGG
jgi:hypothetical protein